MAVVGLYRLQLDLQRLEDALNTVNERLLDRDYLTDDEDYPTDEIIKKHLWDGELWTRNLAHEAHMMIKRLDNSLPDWREYDFLHKYREKIRSEAFEHGYEAGYKQARDDALKEYIDELHTRLNV